MFFLSHDGQYLRSVKPLLMADSVHLAIRYPSADEAYHESVRLEKESGIEFKVVNK